MNIVKRRQKGNKQFVVHAWDIENHKTTSICIIHRNLFNSRLWV